MQAYDENMKMLGKLREFGSVEEVQIKAKELLTTKKAKVVAVHTKDGECEVVTQRDMVEKFNFLNSKYTSHQGSKEMARRRRKMAGA